MKQEDETLGSYIQRVRISKDMSLRQLAERASVDKGYLSRVEKGERSVVSEDISNRIARALEVDVEEFRGLSLSVNSLPSPRTYFRRKLGVNAEEADILAKLVEDYRANKEEVRDEDTNQS